MAETAKARNAPTEVMMPRVTDAQLAQLIPGVPYIVCVPNSTPEKIVKELIDFFDRAFVNVLVVMADGRFKLLTGTVPNIAAQPQVHPVDVPKDELGKILSRNFTSALHEDAETLKTLHKSLQLEGMTPTNQTLVEAMVRVSILNFNVLPELWNLLGQSVQAVPLRKRIAAPKAKDEADPAILNALRSFVHEDHVDDPALRSELDSLALLIAKEGASEHVGQEVLKLQNHGMLTSGVMTILRQDYPPKPVKAPRKRSPAGTAKKRPRSK